MLNSDVQIISVAIMTKLKNIVNFNLIWRIMKFQIRYNVQDLSEKERRERIAEI